MTARMLLDELRASGAVVSLKPGDAGFRVEALPGVVTPDVQRRIAERKDEVVALLKSERMAAKRGIRLVPPAYATVIYDPPTCCQCPHACPFVGPCPTGWCGREMGENEPPPAPPDSEIISIAAERFSGAEITARLERLTVQASRSDATALDHRLVDDWTRILDAKDERVTARAAG